MAQSTIPGAINAIVAMFTTAPGLTGVQIWDGSIPINPENSYVAVAIGSTDDSSDASVNGTQDWAGLGGLRKSEDYTIRCEASSWSGGDTMAARRTSAFALFGACEDILRANPTLQGTLGTGDARVGSFSMTGFDTPQGPVVTIGFEIQCSNIRI